MPAVTGAPSTPAPLRAKRRRLQPEQRREELLERARSLISDEGIDALNLEHLAEAAGVSKGLVYNYFHNRSSLLMELINRERAHFDRLARRRAADVRTFDDWVRASTGTFLDAVEERGLLFIALFGERSIEAEVERTRRERREAGVRITARRLEAELGIDPSLAGVTASLLTGALAAGAELVARGTASRAEVERAHLTLAFSTIAALREGVEPSA